MPGMVRQNARVLNGLAGAGECRRAARMLPPMPTSRPDDDGRMLRVVRIIASITATGLVAFTVLADALGRLFIDPAFHVSEVLFASLVASWLGLLGLEGISLLRRNGKDHR